MVTTDLGKLVRVPRGLLGLKHPFLGLFLMFVGNAILYVVIGVLMVLNSNLQVPIPETSPFTNFWNLIRVPGDFMAKNVPKMPILFKNPFFGP